MSEPSSRTEYLARAAATAGLGIDEFVEPRSRHVVVDGFRLHYLDWGSTNSCALVLLHGGSLTAHTWDLLALYFRQRFHCVAPDLRGHGESEWSPNLEYSLGAHARDLEGILSKVEAEKTILVGMSLGGLVAIRYAASAARSLAGLVLVDVGPSPRQEGVTRINNFTSGEAEFASVDAVVERALAFNPRRDPSLLHQSLRNNLHELPDGYWTWKYDRRARQRWGLQWLSEEEDQLWDDVTRIACPTLVVRGGESDVFTDGDALELAERIPHGAWVRVEGAGHTIQGDNPRGLVDATTPFLSRLAAD